MWQALMMYLGMHAARTGNANAAKIANLGSMIGSLGSNGRSSAIKAGQLDDYMSGVQKVGQGLLNGGF